MQVAGSVEDEQQPLQEQQLQAPEPAHEPEEEEMEEGSLEQEPEEARQQQAERSAPPPSTSPPPAPPRPAAPLPTPQAGSGLISAHRSRTASPPTLAASPRAAPQGGLGKTLLLTVRPPAPGYRLTLFTSSAWGAGTGSRVFFELLGDSGSSGVVYLDNASRGGALVDCGCGGGGFGRGGVASALFPRMPHLGALRSCRVGTDGRGPWAAWRLRRVEVVHVTSGDAWSFECGAWIDRRCDFQRILAAAAPETRSGRDGSQKHGGAGAELHSSGKESVAGALLQRPSPLV